MAHTVHIRTVTQADAVAITAIYNHYVQHTVVTFEEEPVTAAHMAQRITEVQQAGFPWLVLENHGELVGYAYAGKWRLRSAYRFSAESTVYLKQGMSGRGYGSLLYQALLKLLKEQGFHTVMGGITLPNEASVALHETCGFVKTAHFTEAGYKFGQWLDTGYWQKML